jgi:hypothetical protein
MNDKLGNKLKNLDLLIDEIKSESGIDKKTFLIEKASALSQQFIQQIDEDDFNENRK